MVELSYRRHRFPPVVIQNAVWLYLRFTLSYRDHGAECRSRGRQRPGRIGDRPAVQNAVALDRSRARNAAGQIRNYQGWRVSSIRADYYSALSQRAAAVM